MAVIKFSPTSRRNLDECHADLRRLFEEVLEIHDCAITTGFRSQQQQNIEFESGRSKLKYPESKHNRRPSLAVDAVPVPINWNDREKFYYFAGIVKGVAAQLGIKIRWGGDWDGDNDLHDQTFFDLVHFELDTN